MWFKNLRIYRFSQAFTLDEQALNEALSTNTFVPCNSQDISRYGWVSPANPKDQAIGELGEPLVHISQSYYMICAKKQEKVLPAAVINEAVEEKAAEISEAEGRSVSRKEKQSIKDDVMIELLPRAFTRSSLQYAYIDAKQGYIVINSASANKAEELLTALRESLGSLPVVPLVSKQLPHQMMTLWVTENTTPTNFVLGDECELADPKESGSVIRCKHQDLSTAEINSHLQAGMIVTKLGLNWSQGIDFVLDDQLAIKRLRYEDNIQEKADSSEAQNNLEQFDIEFSVMTIELAAFIKDLVAALDGVNTDSQSVEEIVARVEKADNTPLGVDEVVL